MAIRISRREVFNNLVRIKDSILAKGYEEGVQASPKRRYPAFVNRHTGDLRFGDAEQDPYFIEENWEKLELTSVDEADTVRFAVSSSLSEKIPPDLRADSAALKILFETMDILNQLAAQFEKKAEQVTNGDVPFRLTDVHVLSEPERIDSLPGWRGEMTRIEAESNLENKSPGAYLLRKENTLLDEIAGHFTAANEIPLQFYLLTFNGPSGKISDLMMIETQWGWTFCQGEPDLAKPCYRYESSPSALLRTLGRQIHSPA